MTNGIVSSPPPLPAATRQTESLQETLRYRAEATEVRYTDADGRSFTLSLHTEQVSAALTYDRTAQVRGGGAERAAPTGSEAKAAPRGGHRTQRRESHQQLKELHQEFHDLEQALKESGIEVKGFQKLLHRMLKTVDHGYQEHFRRHDPVEEAITAVEALHVDVTAVAQRVTVAMDTVDPEYWNVENTSQRLVDFATSLYQGGDRDAHREKMVAAMQRGYAEAAQAFGGTLPTIATDTVELAAQKLEEWAAGPQQAEALDLVA